jgi:ribosomal protein S4E
VSRRLAAPSTWLLDKMAGIFAPKPSAGPHKSRECLPLIVILRNRLKYALTRKESNMICMQRQVKVDGKVRTDQNFPAGFMGACAARPRASRAVRHAVSALVCSRARASQTWCRSRRRATPSA